MLYSVVWNSPEITTAIRRAKVYLVDNWNVTTVRNFLPTV